MSSNDMAVLGRYTQRFEREGTSVFIRTFDDATLVHEHECKNTPLGVPNEVHGIAETILAQLALGLVGSEFNPVTGGIETKVGGASVRTLEALLPAFSVSKQAAIVAKARGSALIPPFSLRGVLPVNVFRSSSGYSASFDLAQWLIKPTNVIYVSKSRGNDTTGTGTWAAPYKGFKKALTTVSSGVATTIIVEPGYYDRSIGPNGTSADADLNILANGPVVLSAAYESLMWTAHTVSGCYKATRSAVSSVRDQLASGVYGEAKLLELAADLATCEATANTWYTDGTTVYVHRADGSAPTNGDFASNTQVFAETSNGWFSGPASGVIRRHVYSGVIFEGGRDGAWKSTGSLASALCEVVFDRCTFRYAYSNFSQPASASPNGLSDVGMRLCISNKCIAYANQADGFNHHIGATNAANTTFAEIDCISYGNGYNSGIDNFNGFTSHEYEQGVRVNCFTWSNFGPEFADVNNAKVLNVGCVSLGSIAATVASQNTGFQALDSVASYNVDCVALGSANSRYVGASATMTWENGEVDGLTVGTIS